MTKTRIAMVGMGKIALDQHLPVLAGSEAFELAAVVSQRRQTQADLPVFATPAALYAALPDVGAVAFCTPPASRFALVMEALQAGKHVLMEKPPTSTLSELAELEAKAASSGQVLFAAWHCQFNPAVDHTRALLAAEGVRSVAVVWRESVWRWHPGQDWIWQPGGFGVFDPGINALSILSAILPFPLHVREAVLEFPGNRQTPIAAEITFGAESGIPVTARFDWRERTAETWDVVIETGVGRRLRLSRGGGELRIDDELVFSGPKAEYSAIYRRFAELVASGASEVDAAPLRLVADAFLVGRRELAGPFHW